MRFVIRSAGLWLCAAPAAQARDVTDPACAPGA